jgi:hypothetical protein
MDSVYLRKHFVKRRASLSICSSFVSFASRAFVDQPGSETCLVQSPDACATESRCATDSATSLQRRAIRWVISSIGSCFVAVGVVGFGAPADA